MYNLNKLTFIIGAGAHVPYGFPTGNDFLEDIKMMHPGFGNTKRCNNPQVKGRHVYLNKYFEEKVVKLIMESELLKIKTHLRNKEEFQNYVLDLCHNFIIDLGESGVPSIDSFLSSYINEQRDENYEIIGKAFIYSLIILYEQENPIHFTEQNWIHLLLKRYFSSKSDVEKFFNNPPKIITFNYDNLLEKIILGNLTKKHHYNEAEALEKLEMLRIIHVYGSVNSAYNKNLNDSDKFKKAALSLKVIGEDRIHKLNLTMVKDIILNSNQVIFLGYGFHLQNNELIFGFTEWEKKKEKIGLYSTNIGISRFEQNLIRSNFKGYVNFDLLGNEEKTDSYRLINEGFDKLSDFTISSDNSDDVFDAIYIVEPEDY